METEIQMLFIVSTPAPHTKKKKKIILAPKLKNKRKKK